MVLDHIPYDNHARNSPSIPRTVVLERISGLDSVILYPRLLDVVFKPELCPLKEPTHRLSGATEPHSPFLFPTKSACHSATFVGGCLLFPIR
jgi:hypothetical protein